MRYILLFLAVLISAAAFGQNNIKKTAAVPYTQGPPTFTPGFSASSEIAIDTSTGKIYQFHRTTMTWLQLGQGIDVISGSVPPAYTPARNQSLFAINAADSLYYYNSGTWVHLNPAYSGGGLTNGDKIDIDVYADGDSLMIDTAAVTGYKIAQMGATSGQVLKWNGTTWAPDDDATSAGATGHNIAENGTGVTQRDTLNFSDDQIDFTVNSTATSTDISGKIAQGGATSGQVLKWNGSAWAPADDLVGTDTSGYNQALSISGDTLYLTDGNSTINVDLGAYSTSIPANEIVYGTGTGITSSPNVKYDPSDTYLFSVNAQGASGKANFRADSVSSTGYYMRAVADSSTSSSIYALTGSVGAGTDAASKDIYIRLFNTQANASSDAIINVFTGTTGGDPILKLGTSSTLGYYFGLDNSDGDIAKIGYGNNVAVGAGTVLMQMDGPNNRLSFGGASPISGVNTNILGTTRIGGIIQDTTGSAGADGQILTSTGTGWRWENATANTDSSGYNQSLTLSNDTLFLVDGNGQLFTKLTGLADGNGIYDGNGTVPASTTATLAGTLSFDNAASYTLNIGDVGAADAGVGIKVDASYARLGNVHGADNSYVISGAGGNYIRTDASNLQQTSSGTSWNILTGDFKFVDDRGTKKGIEYSADYSAGILANTRSIPDVGIVQGLISDSLATVGGGISDGDKGDIDVTSSGAVWTVDTAAITDVKVSDVSVSKLTSGNLAAGLAATLPNTSTTARINYNNSNSALLIDDANNGTSVSSEDGTNYLYAANDEVSVVFSPIPGVNQTASGIKIYLTANENQAFGDLCYIDSDGEAHLGDADTITMSRITVMCLGSVSASGTGTYLVSGVARNDSWSLTVGAQVYLSTTGTTGNTITQTAPSGTNDCVTVIGVATHANRILFNPSPLVIELN